jgi:hypothetical protein
MQGYPYVFPVIMLLLFVGYFVWMKSKTATFVLGAVANFAIKLL